MRKPTYLTIIILAVAFLGQVNGQSKIITVIDFATKDALIGANLYSFKQDTCFGSDFYGRIFFDTLSQDHYQLEYSGYRLLDIFYKQMEAFDTIFMNAINEIDLGSTGIQPYLDQDAYRAKCKCCK
jgi:hypothetical protein